ncbi:MAG: adenosylcobinamide-GDP ribazoletransferase, partial [Candidatus Omnitrophota bacterium]|nr:adenosylcobinamide-GDP ribazoletransferase [Candidatus Omnitrophota bacterium]
MVRGSLILIAWIIITGGIHLDGFADTCDGFYGKRSREDILKIMRDSHIGAMGATSLTALLLLKFAILSSVAQEDLLKILVITAVFARWSQVLACTISKYARDEGKAKYFIEYA